MKLNNNSYFNLKNTKGIFPWRQSLVYLLSN
ncbi:hypothetical protein KEN51_CDS0072 [Pseudomonas phage vB_Pae10145-KEN51]|nr:hypothetical protein [Pseudomonas phage PhiPizzaParty]WRQ05930.1 hypothetical protein IPCDMZAV_CDS0408 [Pseudomonas phage 6B]WRQ06017.1 hypothetical protein QAMIJHJT_CDS0086 [Pseudomonas phage 9-Ps-8B]WRQ06425.1 hypothetical protein FOPPYZMZ_CDS0085 [Pseudomonas phage 9Ps-7B]WRQ06776.1 hypothetical protein ZBUARNPM_CDS0027 [Pseudomonas phage 14Ps5-6]